MKIGLTLGKYAPLHKGHQLVIERALAECDKTYVLIYDAHSVTRIPLAKRAGWIRELYPEAYVVECENAPEQTGYTNEIKKTQEDYVLRVLERRPVTHFYSSEPYGEHVSKALGAVDVRVDQAREAVPISATMLRRDTFGLRRYIPETVYRDLIRLPVFLGAPSTGKTTLTKALAYTCETEWMPEYGREYWETHQVSRRLEPQQLVEIAREHLEREKQLCRNSRDWLFVDTNAITTYMFAIDYHGSALPELLDLAKKAETRYSPVFLCETDIPYDNTPDRSGEVKRHVFQKQIIDDLRERNLSHIPLTGNLEQRIEQVKIHLAKVPSLWK